MSSWLEAKYAKLLSPQLDQFKETRNGTFNFRCPYCGDSSKSRTKTRGYIYEKHGKYLYRCHNCGKGTTFNAFLEYMNPTLHKDYRMELFKENNTGRTRRKPSKHVSFKTGRRLGVTKKKTVLDDLTPAEDVSVVVDYLQSRSIPKSVWSSLYYVDDMWEVAKLLPQYQETKFDKYNRLIIPFFDKDGNLTHIQGRALGEDVPKSKRYITLELIPDRPKAYGMNKLNCSKPVLVVEGPIDSMFLDNAVAMGGADIQRVSDYINVPAKQITAILDREPRNKEIINIMTKCIESGYNICIIPDNVQGKDINDFVLNGYDVNELVENNTFSGMKAKMKLSTWKKR